MKTFLNRRLSARLGAAFGFLVLALIVIAAVGIKGVGKVSHDADQLAARDVAGLQDLVTVSEDFRAKPARAALQGHRVAHLMHP